MSSMFTTCPNCRLNLAVTPVDLRVGQGYVRCGRCDRVFNALISLAEDLAREQQSGHVATGTTSVPALQENAPEPAASPAKREPEATAAPEFVAALEPEPSPEPEPEAELILETEPAAEPPPQTAREREQAAPPEEWSKVTRIEPQRSEVDVVEQLATGTFETIVLEGDGFLQTEEHVDEADVDAELQHIAEQISEAPGAAQDDLDPAYALEVQEFEPEEVIIEYTDEPELAAEFIAGPPRTHWAWKAAAAALAAVLVGQVVHHYRQKLVAQPWAEGTLKAVYGAFGTTLEPLWDLKAYDLRQLGGEAMPGAATQIVLRATVQNRGARAQPPPMIRVTLQDRFGNALTRTAVPPQEYLRGDVPARMRADQRLDAELTLDDPNRQAVGFELDACLPDAGGTLHCSNDP